MANIHKDVDRFIGHFNARTKSIATMEATDDSAVFRKSLYVSVLDALARSVYPQRKNKDRFTLFVRNFCDWVECDRVSLPHFAALLARLPEPAFAKARAFAKEELSKWKEGEKIVLGREPTIEAVKKVWPGDWGNNPVYEGLSLDALQHFNLLYKFRNSLVHESRSLGYGIEFPDDKVPYYISTHTFGPGAHQPEDVTYAWELTYPEKFLEGLCASSLGTLSDYLHSNELDPFMTYRFGTYWLSELN